LVVEYKIENLSSSVLMCWCGGLCSADATISKDGYGPNQYFVDS